VLGGIPLPLPETLMSDESRPSLDEDAPDDDAESGAQESASKARPRKSMRARSKSEGPNGLGAKSETPPPVATKSLAPTKSVVPRSIRSSMTPKPASVRVESAKPPPVRSESVKPPVVRSETPKPANVGGESVKPPAVRVESVKPPSVRGESVKPPVVRGETPRPVGVKESSKTSGARSRRPPQVKEKEPAAEAKQATPAAKGAVADAKGVAKARPRKTGESDAAEKFFEEGEALAEGHDRSTLHSVSDPGGLLAIEGHPQRRGAFMRYVGIAVALCAVLCLAALARIALAHANKPVEPPVALAPPTPARSPEPVAPTPLATVVPPPTPSASSAPSAVAAESAAPAEQPSAVPDVPAKSAAEEKADARRALERGKLEDAIMAALRSTSLDPTDADAWLLLGAAYQSAGKGADARLAYSECTKEAKKGEVRECALMLH
jgi:hypothetical protein